MSSSGAAANSSASGAAQVAARDREKQITPETPIVDGFLVFSTPIVEETARRVRSLDSTTEPDVLHKLRVALRRLRSLWWAYEPLLDRDDAKLQRDEFKSLASAAGKTRDWDILHDLLSTGGSMQHSLTSLLKSIEEHRADALSFSLAAIGNAGVERILNTALVSARNQLESRSNSPPLAKFAEERVGSAEKALKKRVKRAVSHEDAGYAVLHEVRISGKKLRYLLEFFSPVLEDDHQATIRHLASVQDELGKLNDLVTSETLLREYSPQLGKPAVIHQAVRYLEHEKEQRMRAAQKILRVEW